jgi:hypothetical protein
MKKLTVGQKVWFLKTAYHTLKDIELRECTISSVGKKYFELEEMPREKFFIETLKHDGKNWMSVGVIYLNSEDYYEEQRLNQAVKEIGIFFSANPKNYMDSETIYEVWELVIKSTKNI